MCERERRRRRDKKRECMCVREREDESGGERGILGEKCSVLISLSHHPSDLLRIEDRK